MAILHDRYLTGPTVPYLDLLRDLGDDELLAREDTYGYRALEYLKSGDVDSLNLVMSHLSDVREEIRTRAELRAQFPNHPATPVMTSDKTQRATRLRDIARYLKDAWPIDRFMTELMAIELHPTGQGRMKGRCPFHDDEHPSMTVSLDYGRFKCWACGAEGDLFDCVGKHFQLDSFRAQIERLADATAGIPEHYSYRSHPPRGRGRRSNNRRRFGIQVVAGKVVSA